MRPYLSHNTDPMLTNGALERARQQSRRKPMAQMAPKALPAPVAPPPTPMPEEAAPAPAGLAAGGMIPPVPTAEQLGYAPPNALRNLSRIGGTGQSVPLVPTITPADIAALFNGKGGLSGSLPSSLVHLTDMTPTKPGSTKPPPAPKIAPAPSDTGSAGGSAADGTIDTAKTDNGGNDHTDDDSSGVTNDGTRSDPSSWGTAKDPHKEAYNGLVGGLNTAMGMIGGPAIGAAVNAASALVDANRANPNLTAAEQAQAAALGAIGRNGLLGRALEKFGILNAPPSAQDLGPEDQSGVVDDTPEHEAINREDQAVGQANREAAAAAEADNASSGSTANGDSENGREGFGGGTTAGDNGDRETGREGFGSHGDGGRDSGRDSGSFGGGHDSESAGGAGEGGDSGNARTGGLVARHTFAGKLRGPGTPTSDSIPTHLPDGRPGPRVSTREFVVNARTTARLSNGDALYELQRQSDLHPGLKITPADIAALFRR